MARHIGAMLGLLIFSAMAQAGGAGLMQQVDDYRLAHEPRIIGELDELTRTRSIAADPAGLAAAADRLVTALRERGFHARLLTLRPGVPSLVFGEFDTRGARRTVVFYAHYDGQPVTPSQWSSDPFGPVMRSAPLSSGGLQIDWRAARPPFNPEWRFFGRAAADDKASIVAFLTAFDALRAAHHQLSVNIKVAWEGEEEAGSPHLEEILRRESGLLRSDMWIIGDAPVHQSGKPMLYFGARGMVGLAMTLYGPVTALHDGHYGNWAPNPAAMAATLISQMRAPDGHILIPGLADRVRPLTPTERQAIRNLPPVDRMLERQFGIGRPETGDGLAWSLMRPALNVRGIQSGHVGEAAVNAIPTDAEVSIDFRLVPDQTPQDVQAAVERFLRSKGWTIVAHEPDRATRLAHARVVRLRWEAGYPAFRSDMSTPAARAVVAAANSAAGTAVAELPMMGGSVPIYLFAEIFEVPVIGLPIVNYDDNQHAANENLRLQNLWDGIRTYAAMMGTLTW